MIKPILRPGSRGAPVTDLQNKLNRALSPSPNLKPDGIFGAQTGQAVRRYQTANWLVVDGVVGRCTWAAVDGTEQYTVLHDVMLVPQQDPSACWLAATSMLLRQSIPRSSVPASLLASDGGLLNDSELNDAANTQAYARHFNLRMQYPQTWTATGLANVLRMGPVATHILWNLSGYTRGTGSSGHFAVIAGIRGDGTNAGTTLRIYDPWPPGRGNVASFGYAKLIAGTPGLTYQLFQR
jgi:hypothetical protein